MEAPPRYMGAYTPEFRPFMNNSSNSALGYENGRLEYAENGVRDIGLVTPGPSMFEVVDRAESALRRKTYEAEQLRTQLLESRREMEQLRSEFERSEMLKVADDRAQDSRPSPEDLPTNVQKDVPVVQNTSQGGGKAHLSPPRAQSPNRQPDSENHDHANGTRQNMFLTSSQREDEIPQLRSRLVEAALKETQLIQEIRSLQWRLSELRLAYDQQQQNIAEAASKALSYRQNLIDENAKMAFEVQVLEQERSVYVNSLLPFLGDFGLEPPSNDAQSIVSALKALLQYLNTRANEKRPTVYHRPWLPSSPSNIPQAATNHSPISIGRELVPRPASPSSPINIMGNGRAPENSHHDDWRPGFSPSRNIPEDLPIVPSDNYYGQEDPDPVARAPERPDIGKRSPALPSLPELQEDDEALPAVAGLRIVGDAVLGGKLTVCGHSINGTALCNFQWNRYYPDGNGFEDIDGASRTEYTVSADDVDTFIAIQCCPMDDKGRQGIQVTEFANGQNPIKCDPTMEDQINSHIMTNHAIFEVEVLVEANDEWENGTLILKRTKYEIRRNNTLLIREPYGGVKVRVVLGRIVANQFVLGDRKQCEITTNDGASYYLAFQDNRVRDCAVLTLRRFCQEVLIMSSKKGKKGGWFTKPIRPAMR